MKKILSNKNFFNERGITLMTLAVMIIVLLILAGVTLSLTLGDTGIITQAVRAKEAQEIAAIKEDMQLAILDKELEKGGTGLTQEELEEIAGNYGEIQEDGNTIKTEEGYEIKIDEIYQEGGIIGGDTTTGELADLLEQLKTEIKSEVKQEISSELSMSGFVTLENVYPVGSIYTSTNNSKSPEELYPDLGWKWEQITNRFLYASEKSQEAGEEGGSETITLTNEQLPSHTHSIPNLSGTTSVAGEHVHQAENGAYYMVTHMDGQTGEATVGFADGAHFYGGWSRYRNTTYSGAHTHTVTTDASITGISGNSSPINILPPYLTVYMWKRIS